MKITRVEYRRLHSFGNYENEEFGAVAEVGPGEEPIDVLSWLRGFVDGRIRDSDEARGEAHRSEEEARSARLELRDLQAQLEAARERWDRARAFLAKFNVAVDDLDIPF